MAKTPIEVYNEALSPEERTKNAKKAAQASVEVRRRHRLFRDILNDILSAPLETEAEQYEALRKLGIERPRQEDAIMLAASQKAKSGDVEAVRFLRDTLGEKPTEAFNIAVSDKPVKAMELGKLTDDELASLADQTDENS